jgi:hypothetical protein
MGFECLICDTPMEYDEGEGNIEDGYECYCCLEKLWKVDILKEELKGGNKLKMDRDELTEKIEFLVNQNSEILNKISDLSDKYGN